MATKKYTVTLPEDLAEEIREKVGPGAFSAYVTEAVRRQFENDKLGELVEWMLDGQEPLTDAELAAEDAKFREYERRFAERELGVRSEPREPQESRESAAPPTPDAAVTSATDDTEHDHPLAA